jgi:HlyD family secretion protein
MSAIDMASPYPRSELARNSVGVSDFSLRGRVLVGSVLAALLLAGIGGWAASAKISGAVISNGTVLVAENVKVIQHPDGGIVRAINVKKGQLVGAGDVLLRLDDVQIRTEQAILSGQRTELIARQARLIAERDASGQIAFPADFASSYHDAVAMMQGEQKLFDSTSRNRRSQQEQLKLQIDQLNEEVAGLQFQAAALTSEIALAQQERDRMGALSEKGLIETARLNVADRELARMKGSQGELMASIARTNARISEVNLRILSIDDLAYTEAQRELRGVDANIAELDKRLAEVSDRLARTLIRAPVSGTVNEMSVTTLGGVIGPAERLLTIVPEDAELQIDFRVAINDIDQIMVGQDAKLRFSAFDQRTTPEIPAVVSRVSAAATTDPQTGQSYYIATAEVTGDLSLLGESGLIPGMPVDVFVQTTEKVAIAYFVKPFTDQIERAFKEE